MGVETKAKPESGRRPPVIGWLSLALSLAAVVVAVGSAVYFHVVVRGRVEQLEGLFRQAQVPKLHTTVEEHLAPRAQLQAGPTKGRYVIRLQNLDSRPVEQLRVVLETVHPEAALPEAAGSFTTEPASRVEVVGDARRALVRFDDDFAPGATAVLRIEGVAVPPYGPNQLVRVFVYTKQGRAEVAEYRLPLPGT